MSNSTQEKFAGPSHPTSMVKAVMAGSIGNMLEWFDYGLYGYFASILAKLFFPASDPAVGLMLTFLVFGLGFVARPLGGIIFGYYADKKGRRTTLAITVVIMGVSTMLMGLLPTYQQIGIVAPLALVLLRLLQGIAAGGEWGSCVSFMVEYSSSHNRTFVASFSQVSVAIGLLMGSLSGVLLSAILSQEALYSWGWRIAFLLGIGVAFVGYFIRRSVDETPVFQNKVDCGDISSQPLLDSLRYYKLEMLLVFLVVAGGTTSYWLILGFMTTYISQFLKLPLTMGLQLNSLSLVAFAIGLPLAGLLADKIGRKRVLLAGCLLMIVIAYPLFTVLAQAQSFAEMALIVCVLAVPLAMINAVGITAVAEIFPTKVRCSAFAISYNIGSAVFGGSAMFIATWLIRTTNNVLSVPMYMIAMVFVTFLAIAFLYKEKGELD